MKYIVSFIITLILDMAGLRSVQEKTDVIQVTTPNDELNTDGDCSLREAIRAANLNIAVDACPAGSGVDTILAPAGLYQISIAGKGEDAALSGDLDITESVILTGAGQGTTIVDGNGLDRVFEVMGPAVVSISGVTIQGGNRRP